MVAVGNRPVAVCNPAAAVSNHEHRVIPWWLLSATEQQPAATAGCRLKLRRSVAVAVGNRPRPAPVLDFGRWGWPLGRATFGCVVCAVRPRQRGLTERPEGPVEDHRWRSQRIPAAPACWGGA
jgi:hypothetical protein